MSLLDGGSLRERLGELARNRRANYLRAPEPLDGSRTIEVGAPDDPDVIVDVRADGQRRLYALRPEPFRELEAWMDDYRHLWDVRFEKLTRLLAEKKKHKDVK